MTIRTAPAQPWKILFVTRVPITAVRFVLPFARRLRDCGHSVSFAFGPGEGLPEAQQSGFPSTLLRMESRSSSLASVRVVSQLSQLIRHARTDIVHTYSPVIGLYGRLAAWRAQAPVVIHSVLGSLLASGVPRSHRLLYLASELATSRLVDLFITLNEADARSMVKYRLTSADKVTCLRHEYGVDLRQFDPAAVDRARLEQLRTGLGLERGIPVIGFVGRTIGAKGILDLFEAYRLIRAGGTRAKLLFLGDVLTTDKDTAALRTLRQLVAGAAFADDVRFLGFQQDVPLYLSLMDVVVEPSHHEGFPRIPVEAGAMGKPSVCTAVPGAEVAIEEGRTGLIVPIRDPRRLSEAVRKIIADPALAREMGERARRRVVELFDERAIVDQQLRIYQDFFSRKGARPARA